MNKTDQTLLRIARVRRIRAETALKAVKEELEAAQDEHCRLLHAVSSLDDAAVRPEDLLMSCISGAPQDLARRISACEAHIRSLSNKFEDARRALLQAHFSETALAAQVP